jgi:hypothetical protein
MTGTICAKTLLVGFVYGKFAWLLNPRTGFKRKLLRTTEIVIIALVAVSLTAGGVFAVVLSPPPSPCSGVAGTNRTFTIIVDLTGYNDSQSQLGPWPVITVQRCDTVVFTVINNDTQAHGFAVASYSNVGLELVGGDHQKLQFQATRLGQFRIYCTSRCTVHYLMQNGLLNVT